MGKKYKQFKLWIKKEKNEFFVLGIFFLILQFVIMIANYNAPRYDLFFWFCNHTPLILSLAFFYGSKDVIKALINVGFIAQFLWTLDFFFKLVFDFYIFKVTQYVFEDMNGIIVLIPILIHVFSTNLALYFTYDKKPTLKVLFISLIYLVFLYGGTLTYTQDSRNVNCIQEICGLNEYTFESYKYFWPILTFLIIVLPTHAIQYLLYRFSNKKNRNKT